MTPRSRRVALATGLSYHVLEWGDPAGEPLVLIHGFLDLAWGWDQVARRLATRFRVIAPDLRGHGDSDWIGAGGYYHFFDYVADVDDLLGRIGRPVALVGHSMGGSVASYAAGTRPERVRRLALLEGPGPPDLGGQTDALPQRTARWIDAWRAARLAPRKPEKAMASLDDAAARLCKHDPMLDPALARELAAHGTRPVPRSAGPSEHGTELAASGGGIAWKHDPLHATAGPYPYRLDVAHAFWGRVACPVLVVDAAESRLRLPDDELARRRAAFADARHVVLPRAGHMMQRHVPGELADLLGDFCAP
jgi:pimeloyl-ACP methyl ester carboxylesterase